METLLDKKKKIEVNFSKSVSYYDENAGLQKQTAERLYRALKPWQFSIPDGPILEIGAGTGFFTKYLIDVYSDREVIVSDLSDEMVRYCKAKFSESNHAKFRVIDAESEEWPESAYALIAGNYVAQWFKNTGRILSEMSKSLKPGGLMLISFPASESFSNWKKYCMHLGLPFTGNTLPDLEQVVIELSMGPVKVDYYEDDMIDTFESVFDFFKHLKQCGTSTNISGKQLSLKQLKLLNDYWLDQNGGQVKVSYHTAFIAVKRDLKS